MEIKLHLAKFSEYILLHFVHFCLMYNHVILWKDQNMKTTLMPEQKVV